ncbi:MAG: rod shape-determining protein, partial [Candidatus Saccharibacteria bacterium]
TLDTAEKIKTQVGAAQPPKPKDTSRIDLTKIGIKGTLLTRELATIIDARLKEMCALIKEELQRAHGDALLSSGVVITGGGAKLDGLAEYMETEMDVPVALGRANAVTGIIDRIHDPALTTAIGLMLEDLDRPQGGKSINDRIGKAFGRLGSIFKGIMPGSR